MTDIKILKLNALDRHMKKKRTLNAMLNSTKRHENSSQCVHRFFVRYFMATRIIMLLKVISQLNTFNQPANQTITDCTSIHFSFLPFKSDKTSEGIEWLARMSGMCVDVTIDMR